MKSYYLTLFPEHPLNLLWLNPGTRASELVKSRRKYKAWTTAQG